MIRVLMHYPSPRLNEGQRTFVPRETVRVETACRQHQMLGERLANSGVNVLFISVNRDFPDSVFIEDTAIILDEVAVLASMGVPSRRGEVDGIEPLLAQWRSTVRVSWPAQIEGGDVLRIGHTLYVGFSGRTNSQGIEALQAIAKYYGYSVQPITVHSCLHLKTACTALPDGRLLIQPAWLDVSSLPKGRLCVPTGEPWAANVLSIGDKIFVPEAHHHTAEILENEGYIIERIDISEFSKLEGGMTCLTLIIND